MRARSAACSLASESSDTATRFAILDIGAGLKDGLPYQPWAADLRWAREAAQSKDNPDVRCLPLGILQMHAHPFPRRIVQVPGYLTILHERDMEYRQSSPTAGP